MFINNQQPQQMRIARLDFVETGTYNPMYMRQYETDAKQAVADLLTEVTHGGQRIDSVALAGVSGQFLRPVASINTQTDLVQPVNGWETKRLRFIAEIHYPSAFGGNVVQYVSGHTNHMGINNPGVRQSIDPNMTLHFNSSILLQEIVENTPMGQRVARRLTNASQLLAAQHYNLAIPQQVGLDGTRTMRPEDLFTNRVSVNTYGAGTNMVDMRQRFSPSRPLLKSRYANGAQSSYLASALNGHAMATQQADYADELTTIMGKASSIVKEDSVNQDNFLAWLQARNLFNDGGSVTWGELCQADGQADHVARFFVGGEAKAHGQLMDVQHTAGQTAFWHSSTNEVIMANILGQSLPAAMLDSLVTRMHIKATNRIAGGLMGQASGSQHHVLITNLHGITEIGLESLAQTMLNRITHQIMPDASHGGMLDYDLDGWVDVFGETRLNLSLGGGPKVPLTIPSFCDALIAPVVTRSPEHLNTTASDMQFMLDIVCKSPVLDMNAGGGMPPIAPAGNTYGF